jgi:hypothetical protein
MTAGERSDMLLDALLKAAVREAFKKEIDALPDNEKLAAYKPSPVLDKRIGSLIKSSYRKIQARRFVKGLGKAAACLCVLLAVSSVILLSVEATRNAIFNAVLDWQDEYTEIKYEGASENNSIYRPTYLPEGFHEKSVEGDINFTTVFYENDAGVSIIFDQQKAGSGTTLVDNEHSDYYEVQISGNIGHLFKSKTENDSSILIWEDHGIVFELLSVFNSDELIRMAESVKSS